ncbi:prepilin peptidase [Acetonema longum]|uniref:Type II secretory pathway, prepilin signal peptidase PulO and related peptidases n=1 Tax=Acetonema longum DSM 6540 TaxID=1009370 RepID=F7NPR1_9FIRM|nr:A24 family peptidase [Acetonema longum]EGO61902.1 type II secretory pathway, prepilin signal peptidase PulO and related peptidases [Acetonema longum DSM 6540]
MTEYIPFCRTALFVYFGLIISYTDYKQQLIFNKTLLWMFVAGIIFNFSAVGLKDCLLSVLTGGGILMAVFLASHGKMGMGDIKLAMALGVWLDWQAQIVGLFMAFVFGGLAGMTLYMAGKKSLTDAIPFGPFMMLGAFISHLYGKLILQWYLSLWYL